MAYEIEKGIAAPKPTFPFEEMEAGDSFLINSDEYVKLNSAMQSYRRKHPNKKFTTRKANETQHRCWRLE